MKSLARAMLVTLAVMASFGAARAEEKPAEFGLTVFKLDPHANDKDAGPFIDKFCTYLSGKVEGAKFVRRGVRNSADEALKLLKDDKQTSAWAIVTPGFYFKNKDALKLTVLAEARRDGSDGEQYTLAGKTAAEKYPEGKKIATDLEADLEWLNRVVLPTPRGAKPVQWVKAEKGVIEACYAILDGEDAADFVLLDRLSMKAFDAEKDFKDFKKGLKSELLPQDFVVELDGRLGAKRDALKKALKELDQNDEGKKVGKDLQTPTFPAANEERLKKAEKAWTDNA